ncbi:unnamed protein product [Choristocarpus tenellus]
MDTKVTQCSSKHCPKGTKVLVPAMVDGVRRKKLMIEDVIPAIKAHIPRPEGHTIFLQQDIAKSNTNRNRRITKVIKEAAGDDIVIETHPTNSPDLNVNDLGFFHSIQQLREDMRVTNTEELVEATMEVFNMYPRETPECVWQSLFASYEEVLGFKGDNL